MAVGIQPPAIRGVVKAKAVLTATEPHFMLQILRLWVKWPKVSYVKGIGTMTIADTSIIHKAFDGLISSAEVKMIAYKTIVNTSFEGHLHQGLNAKQCRAWRNNIQMRRKAISLANHSLLCKTLLVSSHPPHPSFR
jgi:hypothetical protein